MQANAMNMNMNPQQINMANMNMAMAMQRQGLTNQALMSPSPTTPTQVSNLTFSAIPAQVSNTSTTTTATNTKATQNNKGQTTPSGQTQQAQATALIGGKPIMPTQANIGGTPVVLGQWRSVAVSINQSGQTQLISSQAPIRFSQPQLVSSANGQIISSTPIMTNQAVLQAMANLQQQAIPINNQNIMGAQGQSPTIIQGQGLYIRTANPIQGQQGIMTATGVQPIGTIKGNQQNIVKASVTGMQMNKSGQNVVGKALLPIKTVTARVTPTSVQKGKVAVTGTPKAASRGRPRTVNRIVGQTCMTASAATNTVASALQSKAAANAAANQAKAASVVKPAAAAIVQTIRKIEGEEEGAKKEDGTEKKLEDRIERKEKVPEAEKTADTHIEKMDTSTDAQIQKGENTSVVEKQKAIVKPHILTHVIEGFVIQEGPEPFPVQRSSLLTEFIPPKQNELDAQNEEPEEAETSQRKPPKEPPPEFFSKCEFCGSEEQASRFKRSTRFCTMACAKRYNVAHRMAMFKPRGKPGRPPGSGRGIMKKKGLLNIRKNWKIGRGGKIGFQHEDKGDREGDDDEGDTPMEEGQHDDAQPPSTSVLSDHDSASPPHTPTTPKMSQDEDMETVVPHTSPAKWTVSEVYEFVKSMPGCSPYAEEFRSQEIDGQALMLLKEDHLMTTMNMKLGPALKICAKINSIKGDSP
ncbi:hypothetical protein FSP39_008686 [Pinctada imbricata]|uniref:Polyhomeotic-like protein 2 n=1 Tax=Pinctada imbricata TaxID=66713 RepID=A0AA89CBZ8_PINIB|nr:hypothetical protein FSP39_008686 [Pinctada imbricata]